MNKPAEDIAALMEAHHQGDPHAFDSLLDGYRRDLGGYLLNRVRAKQDAEDLFQEISLKVLKNLGSLNDPDRFRSWLFSIAMNSVRSFFRPKKLQLVDPEDSPLESLFSDDASAHKKMERDERLLFMRQCIHALPDRDREVLLLDVMAELPQQEIADRLDLNLNTVKTIIRRAKIKLARMMTEVAHG